jgi:Nif-specific regulatory protein
VLLLEDLHLADRETHEILALLAGSVAALPVLVVATRRPPPASERDRLGEADGVERLVLEPLEATEVASLVEACLGSAELPETVHRQIFEHTGGSPLAVQQLLRHLVEEGVLGWQEGRWTAAPAALERLPEVPAGAEELGWRRLSHLEEGPRRILEAAAVIAEPFSLEEMAALLGREPEAVYDAVIQLRFQACLDRLEEEGTTLYVFSQRRLREALYAGLDRERRRDLHRRFAAVLSRQGETAAQRAAAVADHLWRAGDRAASLPHLVTAAQRAAAVYGHREAAAHYGRAVEAAEAAGEPGAVPALCLARVEALTAAAAYAEALAVVEELLATPPEDFGDPLLGPRAWLAKGRLHGRLGEHPPALESCRAGLERLAAAEGEAALSGSAVELRVDLLHGEALALKDLGRADAAFSTARSALRQAGRHGLHRQRAGLLSILATIFYRRGDWPRARRLLSRGLRAARRAGAGALAARLHNNLGNVLWKTGELDQAQQIYRDNLAECERTHDLWGQLAALHNLGILEASRGGWRRAREFLARSLAVKRRIGAWETEALGHLNLAEAEEVLGHWEVARERCRRGLELLADAPRHPDRWALTAQLASLEHKRGDLEAAARLAEQALEGARRLEDPDLTARCHRLLAGVERDRGEPERAAAHLERAFAALGSAETPESLASLYLERADLALRHPGPGSLARAAADTRAARERIERLSDRLAEGRLRGVEARLAAAEGRPDDAETLFAGAVAVLEEVGARFDLARSLLEWGLAVEWGPAAREPEAARGHLGRAVELLGRLGAEAELARARKALLSLESEGLRSPGESASALPASGDAAPAVLSEVSKIINSTLDRDEVLDRTLDLVLEHLGAERGMIVLRDPLTRELEVAVSRNLGGRGGEGRRLSESVVRRVLDTERAVLAVDALSDHRFQAAESIVASHILSVLCVPLTIRERVAGAIYVDHGRSRDLFGERERELLAAFADQAAIAIENARLYGELDEARQRLKAENESLRREILASHHLGSFIGKSPAIAELKGTLERVARSHSTVLIRGESGTGKGLVGRIIHAISPRREGPFIHFNCAALPESLAESELFGHEKGAFTGAVGRKPGRFELAQEGTIFLDEIGKLSRPIQAKLLRVVEEKVFERVGGTRTLEADVRIIAATNLNLEQALERGEFREDLYYRLNIIPIVLPPLRERRDDIPYLVQHFLTRISQDLGREEPRIDPAVLDRFAAHAWPGNVRELEAAIHRALVLSPRDVLTPADFGWIGLGVRDGAAGRPSGGPAAPPAAPGGRRGERLADGGYQEALARHDRRLIEEALAHCGGSLRETARLLGISRNTLKARLRRYGLRDKLGGRVDSHPASG